MRGGLTQLMLHQTLERLQLAACHDDLAAGLTHLANPCAAVAAAAEAATIKSSNDATAAGHATTAVDASGYKHVPSAWSGITDLKPILPAGGHNVQWSPGAGARP